MADKPASWAKFENGNLTGKADVSVWQGVLGPRQLALGVPVARPQVTEHPQQAR